MARNLRTALEGRHRHAQLHGRTGLSRSRDAHAVQVHARRCARIPRAEPSRARDVLRVAAVAAAVQTDSHGRGHRALLPTRALLSRRGFARGPPARVHAGGHRDELHRARRHLRAHRRAAQDASGKPRSTWTSRRRSSASASRKRSTAGASTSPTRASAWNWWTSPKISSASTFKVFSGAIANGGVVKAMNAKGMAGATQGQIETMTEYAKSFGAKGLAYIKVENGYRGMEIAHREVLQRSRESRRSSTKLNIEEGDLILFAADQWLNACEILGKIRLYCADVLKTQGKLDHPGGPVQFPLGHRISAARFRPRTEPLVFQPSSVHRARDRRHPAAQDRPEESPRPALRHRGERRGTRRRLHSYPSARRAEDRVRGHPPDSARRDASCASATCSKPSATARPRTAASRSVSTGSCAILCNTPSIRDVIARAIRASHEPAPAGAPGMSFPRAQRRFPPARRRILAGSRRPDGCRELPTPNEK